MSGFYIGIDILLLSHDRYEGRPELLVGIAGAPHSWILSTLSYVWIGPWILLVQL